jgi:hypothetical protein
VGSSEHHQQSENLFNGLRRQENVKEKI